MSDHIPLYIQEEILKCLPVKSLIQFRCVSKSWKTLIDSAEFIAAHSVHHTQPQHLIVRHGDPIKYVCFVDDNTFPQQRFVPTVPMSVKGELQASRMVGSSCGLLCFDGLFYKGREDRMKMVVLWNPSIRKSISVEVPKRGYEEPVFGFGVCPLTCDPMIIEIRQFSWMVDKKIEPNHLWKVEVYTLSLGKWRSLSRNLPSKSIQVTWFQVVIDRFIYWSAFHTLIIDSGLRNHNLIMSFDMTNQKFEVIDLPDNLTSRPNKQLSISKLRESLAVLEYNDDTDNEVCDVWMMEDGVGKSFTKLFTIKAPHGLSMRTLGFSKNGLPIIEMKDIHWWMTKPASVVVYDPNTEHMNDLCVFELYVEFFVNSYIETLLLLDQDEGCRYFLTKKRRRR